MQIGRNKSVPEGLTPGTRPREILTETQGLFHLTTGQNTISIKGGNSRVRIRVRDGDIDPKLYREVKAQAILEGITIGQWLNKAIAAKLARLKRDIAAAESKKEEK